MTWDDWTIGQTRELTSVRGRSVEHWDGVELALWDDDSDIPRFSDATFPFLHLFGLRAAMPDGAVLTITTYQNDAYFGLRFHPDARFDDGQWEGIFRRRALPELPVGRVDQVAVFADLGLLALGAAENAPWSSSRRDLRQVPTPRPTLPTGWPRAARRRAT